MDPDWDGYTRTGYLLHRVCHAWSGPTKKSLCGNDLVEYERSAIRRNGIVAPDRCSWCAGIAGREPVEPERWVAAAGELLEMAAALAL